MRPGLGVALVEVPPTHSPGCVGVRAPLQTGVRAEPHYPGEAEGPGETSQGPSEAVRAVLPFGSRHLTSSAYPPAAAREAFTLSPQTGKPSGFG